MSCVSVWKPIEEGNKVIVQKGDNFQIVTITPNKSLDVGKDKIPMSQLIGYPMGSTLLFDGTTVTQVKEEEINVDLELDELESSRDNRNLLDRSGNQELTAEDIQSLKSTGLKGDEIISKLVEKSTTFHMKTKYSQEKYLNRKKKNYLCVFTIRPHTARNLCDMQMICKAATLRYDSLVQLLTFANVHAGSTVMLTESYAGLISKAVLERLGHRSCGSRLINFHHGTSIPVIDVSPLEDYSPKPRTEDAGKETSTAEDKLTEKTEEPPIKTEYKERNQNKTPMSQRKERRNERYLAMTPEIRQRRQQEKQEQWNEVRRFLCPTEAQLSPGMEDRPDCLIVATKFYPVEITLLLMQFLPPGRPFVVHSHIFSTLVDLYNILKRRGSCTQLQLHDTWLRPIQVLPNRTHPVMKMTASGGGFILRGYTVQRLEDPDAYLTRFTMRASTKQLFDEGLISYSK
ncbi:unnamed protein product [Hymenolepis diminuta]|uniref:tRNA (adenine(58)-N(1))-methyltransferase non-catalytic subunit TRM6 n=1 Tax=Hymenolepis diminuta TaxID=6216 RepID=A0A0R3SVL9_HYMDI|nr:unnamed protein product [Hymenolepis diminuta]